MNKRPCSITVISWIFIALGGILTLADLLPLVDSVAAQRLSEFKAQHPFEYTRDIIAHVLAVVCGVFMLYGFKWARCLLVVWMGFHLIIGFLHSPWSGVVHTLLFAVVVYFLFRPRASAHFRGLRAEPLQIQKTDEKFQ